MAIDLTGRGEMMAQRALLTLIAVHTFRNAGLTPDAIRAIARGVAANAATYDLPGEDQEALRTLNDAYTTSVTELFETVADDLQSLNGALEKEAATRPKT